MGWDVLVIIEWWGGMDWDFDPAFFCFWALMKVVLSLTSDLHCSLGGGVGQH